ncbi:hypothetical protein NY547_00785 [Cnuibacter physcomitrellae]|uniref:hypothetical protein n=1 Tax=Cnuibacter physcomitrellae TaxID=1619308 RepID=UPI00217613F5|nr:hypothetical protein [Cnuibacter physcomitrellae]MCS5495773.1 hypothetical protein [Cnuibacter physcomitrellae]
MDDVSPSRAVRTAVEAAVARLEAAGARDEALADYVVPKRVLGIQRAPQMVPVGRVWRLGVLLVGARGELFATGEVTRAVEPRHPNNQAVSQEVRRAHQLAAFKGPFAPGDTVNYDAAPVDLTALDRGEPSGPLIVAEGIVLVRWSPSSGATTPLERYLADRVDLLVDPPGGAGETER